MKIEARKCDRCGKVFELFTPGMIVLAMEKGTQTRLDLCVDCTAELMKFMENKDAQSGETGHPWS